ncbi:unnamed protein product [Trichobilharzia regenti]|nr:unnamed protein product [Trichobilharzia regenti]
MKSNEVNSNAQMRMFAQNSFCVYNYGSLVEQLSLRVDPQNMSNKPKTTPRTTTTPLDIVTSYELKLYSSLSEVYCIYAECLCMLLRQQSCGIQLAGNVENLKPACEWFGLVNETALSAFQRSAVISARIADSKCLYSCAVCAWNYCLPTICQNDHRQITTTFSVILESANKIGLNCLPAQLYTEMATVLAHGLIQPWLPKPLKSIVHSGDEKNKSLPSSTTQKGQKTSRGKSAKPTTYTVPQEGQQCIKKAMDWLVLAGKLFEPNRLDLLQDIDETYTIQPVIPISTRSRLIICWLSARQLISSPPVHRGLFPMDLQGDSSSHGETNYTSDFEAQMRKMSLSNQKEAQIYVETLVTRTLLAVHSLWLTHKSKYISEWPVLVSKLIDEQSTQTIAESSKQIGTNLVGFKDAPSLTEAMYLMQTAFCGQKPNVQIEQPTGKSNIIKEQSKTPVKYDLRLDQSTAERYVELELWTRLAMIAFLTSQYSTVLDIIDLANIRKELTCSISPQQHQQQQSNVDNNYWLIQLLCLRGLAMFGISNQMKIVRQQNLKSGGKYNQQQQQQQQQMQQQTRGKQRLTDVKFKCVELLFRKRRINTGSEDSQTVESSLFEAGEEAFYEASRIAYKAGRYDLLVMSTSLYWTLLNHPTLSSSSSQIAQVLQKIQSFDEKIHNLTKWLSHCLKIEVRNELATQIRNNENKQDKSTDLSIVKIESVLMDSIRTIKEVSSLYETVTIVPYPTVTQFEMDLQLRVNMFTALYDLYSEQGNFTSALAVLAKATQNLPRTKHRMLLFRQLVITKAKLGQSVEFDMQKFTVSYKLTTVIFTFSVYLL